MMLVEGIHLYLSLIKVFRRGSHFGKYLVLGWGKNMNSMLGVEGKAHDIYMMLVEGIHLYLSLIKVFRRGSHFGKYLVLGWCKDINSMFRVKRKDTFYVYDEGGSKPVQIMINICKDSIAFAWLNWYMVLY